MAILLSLRVGSYRWWWGAIFASPTIWASVSHFFAIVIVSSLIIVVAPICLVLLLVLGIGAFFTWIFRCRNLRLRLVSCSSSCSGEIRGGFGWVGLWIWCVSHLFARFDQINRLRGGQLEQIGVVVRRVFAASWMMWAWLSQAAGIIVIFSLLVLSSRSRSLLSVKSRSGELLCLIAVLSFVCTAPL